MKPTGAAADAQPREQRLAELFPLRALHRHERRRGPVVEHARLLDAEAALEKRRQAARDAEVARRPAARRGARASARAAPPGAASEAQAQQRVSEVVPVDHEPDAAPMQRHPRDASVGNAGGFCTSTTSSFGSRINASVNRTLKRKPSISAGERVEE